MLVSAKSIFLTLTVMLALMVFPFSLPAKKGSENFLGTSLVRAESYQKRTTMTMPDSPVMGDPEAGEQLFEMKRCISCHSVAGKGGKIAPDLASEHPHPPAELVRLMWNKAPVMASTMNALDIPWPIFESGELADTLTYIAAAQAEGGESRH